MRNTEPPACDLLHRTRTLGTEAVDLLAAFAGAGRRTDSIHCERERFVGLATQCTERHRTGREASQQALDRLDFLERDRFGGTYLKLEQPTNGVPALFEVFNRVCKVAVCRAIAAARTSLQLRD